MTCLKPATCRRACICFQCCLYVIFIIRTMKFDKIQMLLRVADTTNPSCACHLFVAHINCPKKSLAVHFSSTRCLCLGAMAMLEGKLRIWTFLQQISAPSKKKKEKNSNSFCLLLASVLAEMALHSFITAIVDFACAALPKLTVFLGPALGRLNNSTWNRLKARKNALWLSFRYPQLPGLKCFNRQSLRMFWDIIWSKFLIPALKWNSHYKSIQFRFWILWVQDFFKNISKVGHQSSQ